MQSNSEVEGRWFGLYSDRVVLFSNVDETVEWICESLVDIALDVGYWRAKKLKIQGEFGELLNSASVNSLAE